ncbi:MAG: hypothetical protein HY317_02765 [Acidobacteria bacterium]|nr:hypothetical protein [Acidobacteriota bacterium]
MIALLLGAALASPQVAPEPVRYQELVAQGIALGREGRFDEAGSAFDRAVVLDPGRPEAWVERGGLRFLEKKYDLAVRDLERALGIREDAYTRDLLASSLALAGRTDEALARWNVLGQPLVRSLEIKGLVHTRDRVARREIALAEGEMLDLDRLRESRLRLQEVGIFDRLTLRPVLRGEGRADLEAAFVERHGFFSTPAEFLATTTVNAFGERFRLRYANLGGTGVSLGGQYRWNPNRPEVSLSLDWPRPLGLPAYMHLSSFRGRQVYEIEEPLTRKSRGLDLAFRAVFGPETVGQIALRLRDRSYSRAEPDAPPGAIAGLELGLDRRLVDRHRQRLDASLRAFQAAPALGSDLEYPKAVLTVAYRAFLAPTDGLALDPSTLAAQVRLGWGGDATPLDEMFAPGGSQEMEFPLRAHRQTRHGALGRLPIARSLALANLEWRRRLVGDPTFQLGFAVFLDAAVTGRAVEGPSRRFADVGVGLRMSLRGSTILRLDYGRGLSDGKNAIFAGLGNVF